MSDILKLVKAVNEKCQSKDGSIDHRYWAFRSVELLPELIAEIKRLQGLIDKPPEEADWVADYHLLQSALDGPIIDAARKWHAAYRKAQNSNLMRAKEVERLRSDVNHWKLIAGEKHDDMISWMNECKKKDARIKELEAEREAMLGAMEKMTSIAVKLPEMVAHQKRLEAAFLKAEKANLMHHMDADYADENAREALERIKEGGKDE